MKKDCRKLKQEQGSDAANATTGTYEVVLMASEFCLPCSVDDGYEASQSEGTLVEFDDESVQLASQSTVPLAMMMLIMWLWSLIWMMISLTTLSTVEVRIPLLMLMKNPYLSGPCQLSPWPQLWMSLST